jgi:hypothetical protein
VITAKSQGQEEANQQQAGNDIESGGNTRASKQAHDTIPIIKTSCLRLSVSKAVHQI